MIALLLPLAWAGSGDFPLQATVSCPPQGVCRVLAPPAMTATGSALLLEDADGRPVPNARLSATGAPDRWAPVSLVDNDDGGVRLDSTPPIGAVRVQPSSARSRLSTVTLRSRQNAGQDWWEGETVRLNGGVVLPLADPEATQVELIGVGLDDVAIEAAVLGAVREVSGTVEVSDHWATISFSEPAAIRRLTLPGAPDGTVHVYDWIDDDDMVNQRYLGSYPCQDGVVLGLEVTGRRIAVQLPEPAEITVARGWAPREVLLVRDAGPMTLYGGADGDSIAGLQDAARELLTLPWAGATVGSSVDNPGYAGGVSLLLDAGAPIEDARFRFARSLRGTGLVRIPLPPEVLLRSHADLRDVRVVDVEGRQLPFVVVDDVGEALAENLTVEQTEQPGATELRVALPQSRAGGVVLALSTPARGFSREVTIRSGGDVIGRTWEGRSPLEITLGGPLGEDITATVVNGDDPPLPITVSVAVPRRSLLAQIGEGSRLLYSDRSVLPEARGARLGRRKRKRIEPISPPQYDLRRHGASILDQVNSTAQVGPEQAVLQAGEGPEQQRILIATVIAALVMVGVLGRVLLSAGRSEADGDEGGRGA